MSLLLVYEGRDPEALVHRTEDPQEMAAILGRQGVQFRRWEQLPAGPGWDASEQEVLARYAEVVSRVNAEGGFVQVDVVQMRRDPDDPSWPSRARAARQKFLEEHRHAEDEVRLFLEGAGLFATRSEDQVLLTVCTQGDLISVPAAMRHWFDMGAQPQFRALRWFGTTDGWVAERTGEDIAKHFPDYDMVIQRWQ